MKEEHGKLMFLLFFILSQDARLEAVRTGLIIFFIIEYVVLYYSTQTFKNTVLHKLLFAIELTVHKICLYGTVT